MLLSGGWLKTPWLAVSFSFFFGSCSAVRFWEKHGVIKVQRCNTVREYWEKKNLIKINKSKTVGCDAGFGSEMEVRLMIRWRATMTRVRATTLVFLGLVYLLRAEPALRSAADEQEHVQHQPTTGLIYFLFFIILFLKYAVWPVNILWDGEHVRVWSRGCFGIGLKFRYYY